MAYKKEGTDNTPGTAVAISTKDWLKNSWVARNWQTTMVLVMIVLLAFFVRAYFAYPLSVDNGFLVSGGSDSYYHLRVINHVVDTGQHLVYDFSLNYPIGLRNSRPPLYDWSVATGAMALNALGFSIGDGVGYSLVFSTAIWGALTVIPVYLMTNSVFGRKAGFLAAFLFSLMPGNIERTVFSNADHDAMVLFFVVFSLYFFMRALQSIRGTKWVADWKSGKSITSGIRSYFKQNQVSTIYAALAGVSVAAVAMIWTGYTYLLIIVLVYYVFQLLVDRFKSADSTGVFMSMFVMWAVAFLVMLPVYWQMDYIGNWFDMPVYLFILGTIGGLLFVTTRDYPWTLVIPIIVAIAAVALVAMYFLAPGILDAVMSGQGYLVKSKLYSTISEAQAPDFSTLVMSFGALTFWLALFGLAFAASKVPKSSNPYFVFIVVWGAVAIYMAASAARFLFNATPAFALLGGWILALIIDWVKYDEYFKSLRPVLKSPKQLLRKMMKGRVVIVSILLVLLLLIPNVWTAIDASIPSDSKAKYDEQIHNFIPDWLESGDYESTWYLGAFSYDMPKPTEYWPAAWSWFAQQDSNITKIEDKPAFVSWWDYGFEAIEEGGHPTVADNFQNGYQFAAQFLLSQNESEAIALMIVRSLQTTYTDQDVLNILDSYGIDSAKMADIVANPSNYVDTILAHPELYGNYESDLSASNALYVAGKYELASQFSEETLVDVYHDMMAETGIDIGYFAVDARLFPFNAYTSNIFYAPVELSDQVVDDATGDPVDYYTIYAVDYYGNYYELDEIPSDTSIYGYTIQYTDAFYNTMLYRAFMGESPTDLNLDEQGIPGISGSLEDYDSMQGYNMTHFRMVYRTAYYNPYDDYANHTDAWYAISYDTAIKYQDLIDDNLMNGTVDMSSSVLAGGVVFLQYYEGVTVYGQVLSKDGDPMAGIYVTASDEYGIPHNVTKTDENGYYSVILPFGDNVTVTYSYGALDYTTLTATVLEVKTYNITYEQAMHEESLAVAGIGSGSNSDWEINENVTISGANLSGKVFIDFDGKGDYDDGTDILLDNATVYVEDEDTGYIRSTVAVGGVYNFTGLLPISDAKIWAVYNGHTVGLTTSDIEANKNTTVLVAVDEAKVSLTIETTWGSPASGVAIDLVDQTNGQVITKTTDSDGYVLFDELLAGNYTVRANNTAYTLGSRSYTIDEGESVVETLTLSDAMTISGIVTNNSVAVPYAKVAFMTESGAIWTTADANGHYSIVLPKTNYTVYALAVVSGEERVDLKTITATADSMTVNLALNSSVVVDGSVYNGNKTVASATLTLTSSTGAVVYGVSNADGSFRFALPADTYTLYAVSSELVYWDTITAASGLNISLVQGQTISGIVWEDTSGDGNTQTAELRDNTTVTLTSGTKVIKTVTSTAGKYSFVVPNGTNCQIIVAVEYYDLVSVTYENVTTDHTSNLEMVGQVRDVSGTVTLNGTGLANKDIQFVDNGGAAVNVTVETDANGNFSVKLRPGNYKVVLSENVGSDDGTQYQFITTYYLNVSVGQDAIVLDLESVIRYKISGTISPGSGTITFTDPNVETVEASVSGSYSVYLREGNYTMYALLKLDGAYYAVFGKVNMTAPVVNDLTATAAKGVDFTLKYNGSTLLNAVNVTITDPVSGAVYNTNTTSKGTVTVYMPNGTYSAEVDFRTLKVLTGNIYSNYVRYRADQSVAFDETSKDVDISLTRTLDNSTVNGLQIGADYEFVATSDTAISTNFTATSTSAELAPGNYSVYATNATDYVFLGEIIVEPYVINTFDMTMVPGISINGTIQLDGEDVPAVVKISQGNAYHEVETDDYGFYHALMPAGTYNVTATAKQDDSGVTVSYTGSVEVTLTSAKVVNLTVTKVVVYGVSLSWDAVKQTISAGESAVYSVRVRNTGNVVDSYILNATAKGWNITINQTDLANIPYGQYGYVNVTITLVPDSTIEVDHDAIVLTVTSSTGSGATAKLSLDATIEPSYGVNVTFTSYEDQNGTAHVYRFTVTNTGNIDDKYTITVANAAELYAAGWNVTLKAGTTGTYGTYVNRSISSGGNYEKIYVSLVAISDDPDTNVTIVLNVQSQGDAGTVKQLSTIALFPDLAVPDNGLTVDGIDVDSSLPDVPAETYVAFTVMVLMAALVIYFTYKKGVFGRGK